MSTRCGSSAMFGPGQQRVADADQRSAAPPRAGRSGPRASAPTTMTATAASTNSSIVSVLTAPILREARSQSVHRRNAPPADPAAPDNESSHDQEGTMDLFSPVTLGELELANRVVMAPLTRNRAGAAGVPSDLVVEYYRQRAGVGLIITEGTQPSAVAGLPRPPRASSPTSRSAGWRRVADAVHAERRPDRRAADARRAGSPTPTSTAAGRSSPRAPIAIRGETHTEQRQAALPGAARADRPTSSATCSTSSSPPSRRAVERRPGRRGAARRQRLPAAPVPRPVVQPAHRRLRRLAGEPRALRRRGRDGGRRRDRRRPGRHPHLAGAQHPGRARDRPRTTSLATYGALVDGTRARSAWPTSRPAPRPRRRAGPGPARALRRPVIGQHRLRRRSPRATRRCG